MSKAKCGRSSKPATASSSSFSSANKQEDVLRKILDAGQAFIMDPRLLSRRLRGRHKKDNQLYRSNSFRFEKFDREHTDVKLQEGHSTIEKSITWSLHQVSVCDDYSLPVDYVNKRRPLSLDPTPSWDHPSPLSDSVEVLELYSDPRDSKAYLEPGEELGKLYTTPDKEYTQPYPDFSSDSLSENEYVEEGGDVYEDIKGDSKPYYYGDLGGDAATREVGETQMSPRAPEEMPRRLYETAFDSKVAKQEQDPDDVNNKSIMVAAEDNRGITAALGNLSLDPPATAPLPAKFNRCLATVHSTPDLPLPPRPPSFFLKDKAPTRPRSLFSCKEKAKAVREILEIKGRPVGRRLKYSSTESMATSSSGGSLESVRSSTSDGNRSSSSSESRRSSSLSSHGSDSPPQPPRLFNHLHVLSPISDKSGQEPCSETSENNKNNNSQRASPEEVKTPSSGEKKRRTPQNRNLLNLCFDQEAQQGSDSGISVESRENHQDLSDLPFDMPKLRRRRVLQETVQDTSGSATSIDLNDLPFDMPKLRRRLRVAPTNSTSSQESTSTITKENQIRPSLSLDLEKPPRQRISMGLSLELNNPPLQIQAVPLPPVIDQSLPLEQQGWYHGAITRLEAENILRLNKEGSFLVRNSESTKLDYSLSLKSSRGFMHMRIQQCNESGKFILGQFSNPFNSIPEMIKFYSLNRLPIRGAEHMCLSHPVIEQLL